MAKLFRQTWALTKKTLLIAGVRFSTTTTMQAFVLPIAFMAFITYARNLFIPNSEYGVGTPSPIQALAAAIEPSLKLVLVSNNLEGDVANVIRSVQESVLDAGKLVRVVPTVGDLSVECEQTFRGTSKCYAAAVFDSSPDNPNGTADAWSYTLRADTTLGITFDAKKHDNDVQVRLLPLQHAIDFAIAAESGERIEQVPQEFMFTKLTPEERRAEIRRRYQGSIINVLAVAFLVGFIGVVYQLVGFMAMERETGISQLVEAMGGAGAGLARLLSYHLAFDIIYLPGWIVMAIILGSVFANTSRGLLIITHILAGLSLSSLSVFGASFFRKAQLSGITVTILALCIGIVGQIINKDLSNARAAILAILFPPVNYLFFLIWTARFERVDLAASLTKAAPENPWTLSGIVLWIFFIVQIIVFPLLAWVVEKWLYGVTEKSRIKGTTNKDNAVEIRGFTKRYVPGYFDRRGGIFARKSKKKEVVVAVEGLNLDVRKGSIVGLLGANGSGKTTTLESVVGLGRITEGSISVDVNVDADGNGSGDGSGEGGMGVCPQKNVLWDSLTVEEHVKIWNKIKSTGDDQATLYQLIKDCDLEIKRKAQAKTLSGGQKRKLQLAIMFTGGSTVCAVDEVSSGLDPLSRRKIWDIILAQRGKCTIMLTTHFLDEADLLSDHIAIMSKGHLKAEGSSVELKARLGGGYRVTAVGDADAPAFEGIPDKRLYDQTVYNVPDSQSAGVLADRLEKNGVMNYHVSGPTIEDVFLKVAEDSLLEAYGPGGKPDLNDKGGVNLFPGKRLGVLKQAWWMFRKRITILRRNYLPTLAALFIPIAAAAFTMLLLKDHELTGCSREETLTFGELEDFNLLDPELGLRMVVGPRDRLSLSEFAKLSNLFPGVAGEGEGSGEGSNPSMANLTSLFTFVDSYDDFIREINTKFGNYTPGGFFLGESENDRATFAFGGAAGFLNNAGIIMQNIVDNLISADTPAIRTSYAPFDFPWAPDQGDTLQFVVYFTLAMSAYPAFFALYPTIERLRQVRALHYSNGVRSLPLWSAYVAFDFMIVLTISIVSTAIFAGAAAAAWFNLGYLFVVILLYGLASVLLSYVISLFARSQLSAFAFAAGGQATMFLLYLIAFLNTLTYAPVDSLDRYLNIVHFAFATVTPIASLIRGLFVSLNIFQVGCRGEQLATYPGEMTLYGGPILYLIVQSAILFGILLWWDGGADRFSSKLFRRKQYKSPDSEDSPSTTTTNEKEVAEELHRVTSTSNDGLRIIHLTKSFGKNLAVSNVSFGIPRSEVFALLGPNGAGKTTTINMVRGDLVPDEGDIFVENISVIKNRARARAHLGVCPQFDAMDQMTVLEHLKFYARIRGVEDVDHNVTEVIKAVGLDPYINRMASKLSGGNKRKLSLGIALMGNPTVLLLDEPSSGMDAASKRVMWTTLRSVVPGRSLVLTTHSMEEADALASRAGILAGKMLALGTGESLRRRHGDRYHVHLVLKSAPNTTQEEMDSVKSWVRSSGLPNVILEDKSFHGQVRFSVDGPKAGAGAGAGVGVASSTVIDGSEVETAGGLSTLFKLIEEKKAALGIEYYSVSQMGLEDIFLKIVGQSGVGEEGYSEVKKRKWWKFKKN